MPAIEDKNMLAVRPVDASGFPRRRNCPQRRYRRPDVIRHVRRHGDSALAWRVFHLRDGCAGSADPAPKLGAGPAEFEASRAELGGGHSFAASSAGSNDVLARRKASSADATRSAATREARRASRNSRAASAIRS